MFMCDDNSRININMTRMWSRSIKSRINSTRIVACNINSNCNVMTNISINCNRMVHVTNKDNSIRACATIRKFMCKNKSNNKDRSEGSWCE